MWKTKIGNNAHNNHVEVSREFYKNILHEFVS